LRIEVVSHCFEFVAFDGLSQFAHESIFLTRCGLSPEMRVLQFIEISVQSHLPEFFAVLWILFPTCGGRPEVQGMCGFDLQGVVDSIGGSFAQKELSVA